MKTYFIASLLAFLVMPVYASKMPMPSDAPNSYKVECASCHMAYPPGLLGQKNWKSIMTGLDKHFGTDASLDPKTQNEITQWLIKNAAIKAKYSALALKIESPKQLGLFASMMKCVPTYGKGLE
jgi:hypothetical protein